MRRWCPVGVDESRRDRHLADRFGIDGLELEHLDDPLVGDQPREAAVVGVGVSARLAGRIRGVVRQRYAEEAAFTSVELVNVAGHAVRHPPASDGFRIEQCLIDQCPRRSDVTIDPAQTITSRYFAFLTRGDIPHSTLHSHDFPTLGDSTRSEDKPLSGTTAGATLPAWDAHLPRIARLTAR